MSKYPRVAHVPRIYLINEDGVVVRNYQNITEAANDLRGQRVSIGDYHFVNTLGYAYNYSKENNLGQRYDYILRDDRGRHIGVDELHAALVRERYPYRGPEVWEGGKDYRRCPVGRGGKYGSRYHSTRGEGFMGERRETEFIPYDEDLQDYHRLVRAKRKNMLRAITDWDGPLREWGHRSWKNYRRQQYKA
jgi:hypothetical protein